DLHPAHAVRAIDEDLAVESAGAQQGRIEDLGPVGRGEQDQAAPGIEPVELGQQLVQRLLLLVVPAEVAEGAPGAAERIDFVDEDDRRRLLRGLGEEIAHPRRADADEHLDELRAVDREEGHARLAGHRPGEQRLAGARRPHEENALGQAGAEPAVLLRRLQESDDLLELRLGLVHAGDVVEADLDVVSTYTLALLLPTDSSPPPTPPRCCIRRIIQYQKPMSSAIGSTQPRMSESSVLWTVPVKVTLCFASAAASSGSTRTVTNSRRPLGSGSTSRPRTWFSDTQTSSTLPFSSCSSR